MKNQLKQDDLYVSLPSEPLQEEKAECLHVVYFSDLTMKSGLEIETEHNFVREKRSRHLFAKTAAVFLMLLGGGYLYIHRLHLRPLN